MNTSDICRIRIHETLDGTFYIPERRVYKTRWFSDNEYVWEPFVIYEADVLNPRMFCRIYDLEVPVLKDLKVAEYYCKEYIRVHHSDKVLKVWSINEDGSE